jgi:hypothetical protein
MAFAWTYGTLARWVLLEAAGFAGTVGEAVWYEQG